MGTPKVLVVEHPVLEDHLTTMRSKLTERDQFTRSLKAVTRILLPHALEELVTFEREVTTPLNMRARGTALLKKVAVVPILRAGLNMAIEATDLIPRSSIYMAGMYRDHNTLEPVWYRNWLPDSNCDELFWLVLDVMLATGGSAVETINAIKKVGGAQIAFVGILAAPEGLSKLTAAHPDVKIILAAIDARLTNDSDVAKNPELKKGYIVPGLGDAGDRQFGT